MKKTLGTMLAIMVMAIAIGTLITAKYAATGEIGKDGRFISYDNGTVLDTKTKLVWAAKDNGSNINWANAKSYCENYRGGGYSDWRMPTQDEMVGLYGGEVTGKNGYKLTNLIELTRCCPWASETRGSGAARFDFILGRRYWPYQSHDFTTRALPVRSAKYVGHLALSLFPFTGDPVASPSSAFRCKIDAKYFLTSQNSPPIRAR